MSDPKPTGFYRRFAVAALVVLAFTGFLGMIVSLLRDRQHGLSITASLANVPYSPNLQGNLIAGVILVAILWFRVVRRPSGPGWPRVRLRGTVWGGLWILTALAFLLLPRLGGRAVPWAWHDWAFVAVALVGLGRIIYFWTAQPSPEQEHFLDTGDASRLVDERALLVRGRAARTAILIFLAILTFGGMLYEVLVTAQFPVRTFVEVLLFTIIWSFTTAYWNRRT